MKAVDSVVALCHREERLSVISLDPRHKVKLSVQLYRAGIKGTIHTEPLHEIRIGLGIHVKFPEWRDMIARQYRVLITVINAIVEIALHIFTVYDLLVPFHYHFLVLLKYISHVNLQFEIAR